MITVKADAVSFPEEHRARFLAAITISNGEKSHTIALSMHSSSPSSKATAIKKAKEWIDRQVWTERIKQRYAKTYLA